MELFRTGSCRPVLERLTGGSAQRINSGPRPSIGPSAQLCTSRTPALTGSPWRGFRCCQREKLAFQVGALRALATCRKPETKASVQEPVKPLRGTGRIASRR